MQHLLSSQNGTLTHAIDVARALCDARRQWASQLCALRPLRSQIDDSLATEAVSSTRHARFASGTPPTATSARHTYAAEAASISAVRCTLRDVPGKVADLLAETMLGLGAQSASVTEHRPAGAEEQKIYDAQRGIREVWDRCIVTAHFSPDHDVEGSLQVRRHWPFSFGSSFQLLQVTRAAMGLENLPAELSDIADSEWLEGICSSYQPTEVADGLWIVPSWCEPPQPEATNIVVEPGLAFGTGEHPTTRLCLRAIYEMGSLAGMHMVDYGAGSGVLALTALKMGANLAVGTDTDPVAVRAASQNGVLNRFPGRMVSLHCAPSVTDPDPLRSNPQGFQLPLEYDLCVANILRGPLLDLQPRLSSYVKPGGKLVLSGILETQVADIQLAYGDAFENFEVRTEDLWSVICAEKKS